MAKATQMSDTAAQFMPLMAFFVVVGVVSYVVIKKRQQQNLSAKVVERAYPASANFSCPNCQSDNIAKVSLVVSNSTKSFQSSTVGIGLGAGGAFGVGGAGTTGSSQSVTAEALRAPGPKPVAAGLLGVLAGLFFALHDNQFLGVTILVISIAALLRAYHFNNNVLPKLIASWNELYLCQRCATVFKINK